jgi:hypothetical protein
MDESDLRNAHREVLDVLQEGRATKGYLIERTGYSRNTVYNVLEVLEAAGHIEAVHEPTRLFEVVDDPRAGTDTYVTREPESPTPTDPLADLEFPQGRDREACLDAIRAAESFLREHESARMREIVTAIQPDHPLGYDVVELAEGERYRGAWWRKVVKPGLEALETVEKPSGGQREWRWVGE